MTSSSGAGKRLQHWVEYRLFRITRWKWAILPEVLAVRFGGALGWLAGTLFRIRRRDVDFNLTVAFPDETETWRRDVARRSYQHLGREAAVIFRMGAWSRDEIRQRVRLEGFDEVRKAAERGKGVLLLTAHLGNWEVAGAGIVASGLPLDVVGKGMANRRFEADLFSLRERLGMRVIEMGDAAKGVLRSLAQGRVIAMLGDQNVRRNGVFLPFFGRAAATPKGPAVFALRTGTPVFVGFAIRDPGWGQRYTLRAVPLEYEVTGDAERDTRAVLMAYHAALEAAIRSAPDQYFWQHKRWKTRPAEEQAPRG